MFLSALNFNMEGVYITSRSSWHSSHWFYRHLLGAYCVPGSVLSVAYAEMEKKPSLLSEIPVG